MKNTILIVEDERSLPVMLVKNSNLRILMSSSLMTELKP